MQEEKKIEPLARQLDGATPPLEIIDEYHSAIREDIIKAFAAPLLLSIFDETGAATETILNKINADESIPLSMKTDVYNYCVKVINKMIVDLAKALPKGGLNVRSKEISEKH